MAIVWCEWAGDAASKPFQCERRALRDRASSEQCFALHAEQRLSTRAMGASRQRPHCPLTRSGRRSGRPTRHTSAWMSDWVGDEGGPDGVDCNRRCELVKTHGLGVNEWLGWGMRQ